MEELEEYEVEERQEPFRIENDEQAAWAMRKFKSFCDKIEENENILAKERLRWQAWLDEVNRPLVQNAAFFEDMLKDYLRRNRDDRKSIKLPHGTIKSRQLQDKVELDEGFIDWAKANRPELLRLEYKPNLTAIKQAKDLEFVEVVEGVVSYSVELR